MRTLPIIAVLGLVMGVSTALRAQDHSQVVHTRDHMEHSFADAEKYAKSFDDPARDVWQMPDRVIAALGLKPGQSVADLGAGTGYFSVRLARTPAAPKVFAVDIEQSMVDYVQARAKREGLANVVGVKADAGRSNLPEAVDVVLIVDTYHHIPNRVGKHRFWESQPLAHTPRLSAGDGQTVGELISDTNSHSLLPRGWCESFTDYGWVVSPVGAGQVPSPSGTAFATSPRNGRQGPFRLRIEDVSVRQTPS